MLREMTELLVAVLDEEIVRKKRGSSTRVSLNIEVTRVVFNSVGQTLATLHVREGDSASGGAIGTAVDRLKLENQQNVSGAGQFQRGEIILQILESNIDYCTFDCSEDKMGGSFEQRAKSLKNFNCSWMLCTDFQ